MMALNICSTISFPSTVDSFMLLWVYNVNSPFTLQIAVFSESQLCPLVKMSFSVPDNWYVNSTSCGQFFHHLEEVQNSKIGAETSVDVVVLLLGTNDMTSHCIIKRAANHFKGHLNSFRSKYHVAKVCILLLFWSNIFFVIFLFSHIQVQSGVVLGGVRVCDDPQELFIGPSISRVSIFGSFSANFNRGGINYKKNGSRWYIFLFSLKQISAVAVEKNSTLMNLIILNLMVYYARCTCLCSFSF